VEACPKDVNPMGQIMRLRRIAGADQHITDKNNGHRHEEAFTTLVKDYGLNHEAELLARSYGGNSWFGKFHPAAGKELLSSVSIILRGLLTRKVNPKIATLGHKIPKQDLKAVKKIYETVESRPERYELNLYVSGEDEDPNEQPLVSASASDAVPSTSGPEGSTNP
jgi:succinate dehydrogenase / fumarate reductase iron-sulfur subunit